MQKTYKAMKSWDEGRDERADSAERKKHLKGFGDRLGFHWHQFDLGAIPSKLELLLQIYLSLVVGRILLQRCLEESEANSQKKNDPWKIEIHFL